MKNKAALHSELIKSVWVRYFGALLALVVLFFLPAGTLAYWEAWVYLVILFVPIMVVLIYLLKNDPELLARRMKLREKEPEQKRIVGLSYIPFLITFLLPGFDIRFGWSHVPAGLVVLAEILVFLGYCLVFLVFRENRYASRVIEVEQEQTVVSSGPYAVVRHPMYIGMLVLYILSPLALGSYWAMIPAITIVPVIVARIRNEESVLTRDLKGYREYLQNTKYRLIPGVW